MEAHPIVEAWLRGERPENVSPEQWRAVGLIVAGAATDEHLEAAGSDFCLSVKSDSGLFRRAHGIEGAHEKAGEEGVIPWTLSMESTDRAGDVIRQKGWDLKQYKANPVVLYGHNHHGEPIGRADNLRVEDVKGVPALVGDVRFAVNESEDAARLYRLAAGKFLRAGSVGFRPLKTTIPNGEEERSKLGLGRFGVLFDKSELLEFSLVTVPAHPGALQRALKEGTLSTEDAEWANALGDPTEKEWEKLMRARARDFVDMGASGDLVMKPGFEETPNELRYRVREPGKFQPDSFRRITLKGDKPRVYAVIGKLKGESSTTIQALRFPKGDGWSVAKAQAWIKKHPDAVKEGVLTMMPDDDDIFEEGFSETWVQLVLQDEMDEFHEEDAGDLIITKFVGSPRNKYGTHASKGFKGNYAKAWRIYLSQVNGGALTPAASGPLRGTVRRVSMIAAGMKPACNLPDAENIGARGGAKSPLPGKVPEKPSDYGLSQWAKPSDDNLTQEDIRLTCKDLAVIKRATVAEVKRRIKDREAEKPKELDPNDDAVEPGPTDNRIVHPADIRGLVREFWAPERHADALAGIAAGQERQADALEALARSLTDLATCLGAERKANAARPADAATKATGADLDRFIETLGEELTRHLNKKDR